MYLSELSIRGFRNYRQEHFRFQPGVNLIVGSNAQGKTNLLEAIAYLGSGRSFRAQKTSELIAFGAEFAELEGKLYSQNRDQSLRYVLFPGSRPRILQRNGAKKKILADMLGVLPTVLFCPEDLLLLKSGAASRRRMGDDVLCQLRPNYDAALTEYNRLLEHKSRILKDYHEQPRLLELLPDYNIRLCQVGALLISYRARFYDRLGKSAKGFHHAFSGGKEDFSLEYQTVSSVHDPFASLEVLKEELQEHMQSHGHRELESGQCLSGPHKDDFAVTLSGLSLKQYGSQGQTRTAAISLKLAQRELMANQLGEEPVLLLDDVLSELDPGRQDFVLNQISSGQVFITCCEPARFTRLGATIEIDRGSVAKLPLGEAGTGSPIGDGRD